MPDTNAGMQITSQTKKAQGDPKKSENEEKTTRLHDGIDPKNEETNKAAWRMLILSRWIWV